MCGSLCMRSVTCHLATCSLWKDEKWADATYTMTLLKQARMFAAFYYTLLFTSLCCAAAIVDLCDFLLIFSSPT